jgi:hypothetical protein
MTTTFLLRCALIGATTGLIIRIIMLFVKKQPRSTVIYGLMINKLPPDSSAGFVWNPMGVN